ncbi:MAG: SDR family NAD(P)-dependent oxidoreductase, partial [Polymorphobacter sp.]
MQLLVLGLGYTATRIAAAFAARGGSVTAVRSQAAPGVLTLASPGLPAAIAAATHILSSVPPAADGSDPVLAAHAAALAAAPARWSGYLSSTGVYGNTGGAWVDESASVGGGRRSARVAADQAWQALRPDMRVFRLPGIYGPGRSALDRVLAGDAKRIDAPGHLFSRIHVDDSVAAVIASFDHGSAGVFNIADAVPATGASVTEYACDLLSLPYPPLEPVGTAGLSPMARGFYAENRRIAAAKMTRDLGV